MTKKYSRILCGVTFAAFAILIALNAKAESVPYVAELTNSAPNSCSMCCFPSSQGWNKVHTLTNYYFVGPYGTNTSYAGVPCMANTNQFTKLLVSTCATVNGTILETGLRISSVYSGTTYWCRTNNCLKLTTNMITMSTSTNRAVYKVQIYYKGATVGTNTTIQMDWEYRN